MYSFHELRYLSSHPKINSISLKILQEYYEAYLHNSIFEYQLQYTDGTYKNIQLFFNKENFCHLLGIESIAKYKVEHKILNDYRGLRGWNNIKNNAIDFAHLKSLNKRKFKDMKARFV